MTVSVVSHVHRLGDDAGVAISKLLLRKSKLSQLLLSENELGPESGDAISEAWRNNVGSGLRVLDVRGNLIGNSVRKLKAAYQSAAQRSKSVASAKCAVPFDLLIDEETQVPSEHSSR